MSDKEAAAPTPFQAWWAVVVLFIAATFSYIDRYVIGLLVGPLKAEFQISDWEIGLLNGMAFAIFYCVMGLPIAWLADRKSRRAIISVGIACWCVATTACGFAQNFWQLFLARMGVGVGESVLSPSAYSLIADLFPKEKRGFAYGVFGMGVNIGGGLAFIVGATIIAWIGQGGEINTAVGTFKGWQLVFITVGLPGLLVALLMMTIVEPRHTAVKPPPPPKGEFSTYLAKNSYLLTIMLISFSIAGMIATGFSAWGPTFYVRTFNLTPAEAGWGLGMVMIVATPIGTLIGGWLLKRWTQKGYTNAPIRLALLGMISQVPFKFFAVQMPSWELALLLQGIAYACGTLPPIAGASALQLFTPPSLRARVSALYFFVVTVIAIVLGPFLIGLLTDLLFGEAAVAKSLYTTVGIFGPTMIILMLMVLKPYSRAVNAYDASGGK